MEQKRKPAKAVPEQLGELGREWQEAYHAERQAKAARIRAQNKMLRALRIDTDERICGTVPGSIEKTGVEVYREPERVHLYLFVDICEQLGVDSDDLLFTHRERKINSEAWAKLTEAQRTAILGVGVDLNRSPFKFRLPKTIDEDDFDE